MAKFSKKCAVLVCATLGLFGLTSAYAAGGAYVSMRISAIAIACFGIIRSLLFLTYSFTLTDRNPLFFSLIHPLIRSDGCCEPIDPVTHPLPSDFRSCCTIH